MLCTLHIRDFVIVESTEIHFQDGFTVFSGETGAGKSILVDALSLALGARGDVNVIRPPARRADITAVFEAPESLSSWLDERELDADEGLVLRRTIDAQGRSRAFINGLPVTLTQLRELGEYLVDIHGQHAHQSLLKAAHQRALLDAQGGHAQLSEQVSQAWQAWQHAQQALDEAQAAQQTQEAQRQELQWQLEQLEQLDLQEDEWLQLTSRHQRLAHVQTLMQVSAQALERLDGEAHSVQQALSATHTDIQGLVSHDASLQPLADSLESALIICQEASSELGQYASRLESDPAALAATEKRMSALFDTARRLQAEPQDLSTLQASLHSQLHALDQQMDMAQLEQNVKQAQDAYDALAHELSKKRQKAASRLSKQVTQSMQELAMEGGRFDIALTDSPPSRHGNETVEFLVAGHAGTAARPLARVASGGELARLSLALSVIASQAARVPTLIFDEVDSGVGGAVAEVVGRLLRELGQRHQVLCVTHLPQVAACGSQHFEVSKHTRHGSTESVIAALDSTARVEEVARMLGGLDITDTTRRHAREMLGYAPS